MLSFATGMPQLDARDDFRRARRAARAARWLRRRSSHPRTLTAAPGARRARLRVIPVAEIVGTLEPTLGFDADFRPTSEHVRTRWERISLARRRGLPLPPITVVERPDGYYVVDGRHRVSVARAYGDQDIDAWVT